MPRKNLDKAFAFIDRAEAYAQKKFFESVNTVYPLELDLIPADLHKAKYREKAEACRQFIIQNNEPIFDIRRHGREEIAQRLKTIFDDLDSGIDYGEKGHYIDRIWFKFAEVLYCLKIIEHLMPIINQGKPPALTFDRLFATPEHIETTLAALHDLGIIDDGNRWSYGKKKAAICAALAVLKRRDWFDSSPPDVELAQCFAAFLGTEIGQSTVYDYAAAPPSYAADIVTDLSRMLPKE